jgi:hypothetical protein
VEILEIAENTLHQRVSSRQYVASAAIDAPASKFRFMLT